MPDTVHENGNGSLSCVTDPADCSPRALKRARQALGCLPFRIGFYRLLQDSAISSVQLVGSDDLKNLCRGPLTVNQAEDHFIWLIQLGVLRREVDGQGLTERVRLTPLGREVLDGWPEDIPVAGPIARLRHWWRRHRPRW